MPPVPPGARYTAAAAGNRHSVLLRSDGAAVACGYNSDGQTDVPALPPGVWSSATLTRLSADAAKVADLDAIKRSSVPALARFRQGATLAQALDLVHQAALVLVAGAQVDHYIHDEPQVDYHVDPKPSEEGGAFGARRREAAAATH